MKGIKENGFAGGTISGNIQKRKERHTTEIHYLLKNTGRGRGTGNENNEHKTKIHIFLPEGNPKS